MNIIQWLPNGINSYIALFDKDLSATVDYLSEDMVRVKITGSVKEVVKGCKAIEKTLSKNGVQYYQLLTENPALYVNKLNKRWALG